MQLHPRFHMFSRLARARVPSRRKQFKTSRVSTSENHNFIRAPDCNADCETGFSIPVSETKIHGSRETAGEVDRRARRYLVDKLDRISRIPLRISTRSRIWSATAMQQGNALSYALHRTHLHLATSERKLR